MRSYNHESTLKPLRIKNDIKHTYLKITGYKADNMTLQYEHFAANRSKIKYAFANQLTA